MVYLEKTSWWSDSYAEVLKDRDVTRQPVTNYGKLLPNDKDMLRQTQIFSGEVVKVLGVHEDFSLVKKFEGTVGWVPSKDLKKRDDLRFFPSSSDVRQTPGEFFRFWKGTVYEFGGISKNGIDCSGFTQLYFMFVHGRILPKNSKDQRKLGRPGDFADLEDNDLVFCRPYRNLEFHHVALYYQGQLWHSRRTGGVICQTTEQFEVEYKIEEVRTLL